MGRIIMPPKKGRYSQPKAVGQGSNQFDVKGRVMIMESFPNFGDYMRILDLIEWNDGNKELRLSYYYRKSGGGNTDWVYGQGAGHTSIETFYNLIQKAKTTPDYGSFEGIFDRFSIV